MYSIAILVLNSLMYCFQLDAAKIVQGGHPDIDTHFMNGLDCRSPHSIQNGLLSDVCGNYTDIELGPLEDVAILQYSTKHIVPAFRCEKKVSKLNMVCGSFSHSKIMSPPSILSPAPFTSTDCSATVKRLTYQKEDGNSLNVDINRSYDYKYIEHGKLMLSTDNVGCKGSDVQIHGELHSSVVTLVTVSITIKQVDIEVDIRSAMDLDRNIRLPASCYQNDLCDDNLVGYVLHHPKSDCPLYRIRTVPMNKIQVKTASGYKDAFLSTVHKLLLILGPTEVVRSSCKPVFTVTSTLYTDLKLVHNANALADIKSVINSLGPSTLDLDLELRVSDEYLTYDFEQKLQQYIRKLGMSLCHMNRHTLIQSERSPFHKNAILRIRGEVIQELSCTPVQVEARIGDKRSNKCLLDSLPVWLKNEPMYLQAGTNLVVSESEIAMVICDAMYTPVFKTQNDVLLQANPDVQIIDLQLSHVNADYLHTFSTVEVDHETYSQDLLYTSKEIAAFNDLIHYQRAKAHVLNNLVMKYCQHGQCGAYTPKVGISTFDLSSLEDKILTPLAWFQNWKAVLQEYGSYCSLAIVTYLIIALIAKFFNVIRLICTQKLNFGQAMRLNFFIASQISSILLQDHEAVHRPVPGTSDEGQHHELREIRRSDDRPLPSLPAEDASRALIPYVQHPQPRVRASQDDWYNRT